MTVRDAPSKRLRLASRVGRRPSQSFHRAGSSERFVERFRRVHLLGHIRNVDGRQASLEIGVCLDQDHELHGELRRLSSRLLDRQWDLAGPRRYVERCGAQACPRGRSGALTPRLRKELKATLIGRPPQRLENVLLHSARRRVGCCGTRRHGRTHLEDLARRPLESRRRGIGPHAPSLNQRCRGRVHLAGPRGQPAQPSPAPRAAPRTPSRSSPSPKIG